MIATEMVRQFGQVPARVPIDGGSLVDYLKSKSSRVVDSVAALRLLDKTKFTRAFVTGYYAAGDGGGGAYWYDSTDTTSADNGGAVIVAADGGRWKLIFSGPVNVRQFGAKGDGVTDDRASIQAAIDYARPGGLAVYVPRGVYLVGDPGITLANTGAGSTGGTQSITYRLQFFGDGAASTIFVWGGTTGNCITVITGGESRTECRSFSVLQKGATKQGTGIFLNQSSEVTFEAVNADGFEYGWRCVDNFSIQFFECAASKNKKGLYATKSTISDPNDFTFFACNFRQNAEFGAIFDNPTTLSITGGSFETNGTGAGHDALKINGGPKEGIVGANISGVYFEGNIGDYDVSIRDVGGTPGIHNVTGCTFNRISNAGFTFANVAFVKTTAAMTKVKVEGCGFAGFNTYVADASRRYIQVPAPLDTNYLLDIGTNIYGSATETPSIFGAAGKTLRAAVAVRFNGATGAITGISHNVASVVRNGVGDYTINYAKALNNANNTYCVGPCEATAWPEMFAESAVLLRIKIKNAASAYADFTNISVTVFGFDGAE